MTRTEQSASSTKSAHSLVSAEEIDSITLTLKQKYGIDFTNYELNSLTRGFNRVLSRHNMSNVLDLWARLLKDRDFLHLFIDEMTVNLTELFRNPAFWTDLGTVLKKRYARKSLKVWHAGCSSGEEVYTMAIVLQEIGLLSTASLVGTDLSRKMLVKAWEGDYKLFASKYKKSLREVFPQIDLATYFDQENEQFKVRSSLKSRVNFFHHNLVKNGSLGQFDIIFCRNVMIYFDDELRLKVLDLFWRSLREDGLFIIGFYDMIPQEYKNYFVLEDPVNRIYRKRSSR